MSIAYDKLHSVASLNYPKNLPIKTTSTWIAILLHNVQDVDNIQSEKDFLWIKCHKRITLKTIKYQYWSRYPMEELRLVFDRKLVKPKLTVSEIRKLQKERYPEIEKEHENIVVLRALEPEDWEMEQQLVKDRQLTEGVVKTFERDGRQEEIIEILSDDDDEAQHVAVRTTTKSRSPDVDLTSEDDNVEEVPEYTGLGAYSSGHVASLPPHVVSDNRQEKSVTMVDTPHQSEHGRYSPNSDEYQQAQPLSSAFDEQMENYEGEDHNMEQLEEDHERTESLIRSDHSDEDYELLMDAGELDSAEYQRRISARHQLDEVPQQQDDAFSARNSAVTPPLETQRDEQIDSQNADDTSSSVARLLTYTPPLDTEVSSQNNLQASRYSHDTRPSAISNLGYQNYTQPFETYVTFERFPPNIQQGFNYGQWYRCSSPSCQRYMVLKPWTRYHGTSIAPLCTGCTRIYLTNVNPNPAALQHLERQLAQEYNEKERRQIAGSSQNPEDDAPLDFAGLIQGPISYAQPQNVQSLATTMQQRQGNFINDTSSAMMPYNHNMTTSSAPHGYGVYIYGPQQNVNNFQTTAPAPNFMPPAPLDGKSTTSSLAKQRESTPIRDDGPSRSTHDTSPSSAPTGMLARIRDDGPSRSTHDTSPSSAPTGMLASGLSWIKKKLSPKSKQIENRTALQSPVQPLQLQNAPTFDPSSTAYDAGNNEDFDISGLIDEDNPLAVPGVQREEDVQNDEPLAARYDLEESDDETEEASDDEDELKRKEEEEKANYHAAILSDVKVGGEESDDEYTE